MGHRSGKKTMLMSLGHSRCSMNIWGSEKGTLQEEWVPFSSGSRAFATVHIQIFGGPIHTCLSLSGVLSSTRTGTAQHWTWPLAKLSKLGVNGKKALNAYTLHTHRLPDSTEWFSGWQEAPGTWLFEYRWHVGMSECDPALRKWLVSKTWEQSIWSNKIQKNTFSINCYR